METSIVIPNYNGLDWLPNCLSSVVAQDYSNYEIIFVDNHSSDGSLDYVRGHFPEIQMVVLEKNRGFATAVNAGIERAKGEFILLLNTDTELQPEFLSNLTNCLKSADEGVGAVAAKMLQMDDPLLVDDAGDRFSWYGVATKGGRGESADLHRDAVEIFSPSGGATLYRRSFLFECDCFDSRFFAYLEDVDLGIRGRLMGYRYLLCPSAEVLHKSHGSKMAYRKYIALTTCNRLFLYMKNIPFRLLLKNSGIILYGQLYFLLAHGKPLASLRGYLRFFRHFPSIYRTRRLIQTKRKLDPSVIDRLLSSEQPSPSISMILRSYFRRRKN